MSGIQGKISKMQTYPELSSADFAQVKQDKITVGNSEQSRWNSQLDGVTGLGFHSCPHPNPTHPESPLSACVPYSLLVSRELIK